MGTLNGGLGRNVIADHAVLRAETRGETDEINRYMYERSINVNKTAAMMYGVTVEIIECGYAAGYKTDVDYVDFIRPIAERLGLFEILPTVSAAAVKIIRR